jgi:predicted extracellular nuclease
MPAFSVATYNVENLFTRAKALSLADDTLNQNYLGLIGDLRRELQREVYDKARIIAIYSQVEDLVRFNVTRSEGRKFVVAKSSKTGNYFVDVDGRDDWSGTIDFERERFSDVQLRNTAKVIRELNADIMCLNEVESRVAMRQFDGDLLGNRYPHELAIDGNDPRGIDVGLLTRCRITNVNTHIAERWDEEKEWLFSRDCLRVSLDVGGRTVFVLINHFKSKSAPNDAARVKGTAKRTRQAHRVSEILTQTYDLTRDLVIVAGDLNDTPDSEALRPLLSTPDLRDVFDIGDVPQADRWTYHFRGRNQQIDYILVSSALAEHLRDVTVERRGIANVHEFTDGAVHAFDSVTNWRDQASDHAAIKAVFEVP